MDVVLSIPVVSSGMCTKRLLRSTLVQDILKRIPTNLLSVTTWPSESGAVRAVAAGILVEGCIAANMLARCIHLVAGCRLGDTAESSVRRRALGLD